MTHSPTRRRSLPSLSRRQLLGGGAGLGAGLILGGFGAGALTPAARQSPPAGPALAEPAVRRSASGTLDTRLAIDYAPARLGDHGLFVRTYEAMLPGPTLRFRPGDTVRILLDNRLPEPCGDAAHDLNLPHGLNDTNLHLHGLHVSPNPPADDVFLHICPGERFQFVYEIPEDHPAGTYWYHPHMHGSGTVQIGSGMAGVVIIEGDIDRVPEIAAARDVTLAFQQIVFDDHGRFEQFELITKPDAHKAFTVNGQITPVLRMRPGEVQRWRLANIGYHHMLPVALDGHAFAQIAFDGITFDAVRTVDQILLAAGNRSDVLVKAGAPGRYVLRKLSYDEGVGADSPADLMTVIVEGEPVEMALPAQLPAPAALKPITDAEITGRRTITFGIHQGTKGDIDTFRFLMDDKTFDPDRVDQRVALGAVEEWTVTNLTNTDHPYHIHVNPFQVVRIDDQPVADPIWQDTVIVRRHSSVTLRSRFTDFRGRFVLHCHIMPHEDLGMMQVVEVY